MLFFVCCLTSQLQQKEIQMLFKIKILINMKNQLLYILFVLGVTAACTQKEEKPELKVYGKIDESFQFVNQDSQFVNNASFENKIYVTDFFFTSCPTICPKMKSQMILLHDEFKERDDFLLLSHTIDTRHDSVAVLREYAERLGVESENWHFVTGVRDEIYEIAKKYMVSAGEDESAPGGYIHSGAFILIDKQNQIRGYYDGTVAEETQELITDIKRLLDEK